MKNVRESFIVQNEWTREILEWSMKVSRKMVKNVSMKRSIVIDIGDLVLSFEKLSFKLFEVLNNDIEG